MSWWKKKKNYLPFEPVINKQDSEEKETLLKDDSKSKKDNENKDTVVLHFKHADIVAYYKNK